MPLFEKGFFLLLSTLQNQASILIYGKKKKQEYLQLDIVQTTDTGLTRKECC